jgi:hypothetical protein
MANTAKFKWYDNRVLVAVSLLIFLILRKVAQYLNI